jgi:hypothetical protein
MKNLKELKGVKVLSSTQQKTIKGGIGKVCIEWAPGCDDLSGGSYCCIRWGYYWV